MAGTPNRTSTGKPITASQDTSYGNPYPEYAAFLSSLKAGEGGTADVKQAGVRRQCVENRLNKAADSLGLKLKFHRSGQDALIFDVLKKKQASP